MNKLEQNRPFFDKEGFKKITGTASEEFRKLGEAAHKLGVTMMEARIAMEVLGGAKVIYDTIMVDTRLRKTALEMYPYVLKGWKLTSIERYCGMTICSFKLKLSK